MDGVIKAKEGDLYRVIDVDGVVFNIHYGYYEYFQKTISLLTQRGPYTASTHHTCQ